MSVTSGIIFFDSHGSAWCTGDEETENPVAFGPTGYATRLTIGQRLKALLGIDPNDLGPLTRDQLERKGAELLQNTSDYVWANTHGVVTQWEGWDVLLKRASPVPGPSRLPAVRNGRFVDA